VLLPSLRGSPAVAATILRDPRMAPEAQRRALAARLARPRATVGPVQPWRHGPIATGAVAGWHRAPPQQLDHPFARPRKRVAWAKAQVARGSAFNRTATTSSARVWPKPGAFGRAPKLRPPRDSLDWPTSCRKSARLRSSSTGSGRHRPTKRGIAISARAWRRSSATPSPSNTCPRAGASVAPTWIREIDCSGRWSPSVASQKR
jgi:hypothetical protein